MSKKNNGLKLRVQQLWQMVPTMTGAHMAAALRATGHLRNGRSQLDEAGGQCLDAKDCLNWTRTIRKTLPDHRLDGNDQSEALQLQAAQAFLENNGWDCHNLGGVERLDRKGFSHGIVFARPVRLEKLTRHGRLTLMDSTHKTNRLKWFLYTLFVWDGYGCFVPAAHLLLSSEESQILAAGLKQLKIMCARLASKRNKWEPCWLLTDDSASEQLAVKKTFRGLEAGELEVDHLLCTVHSERTLRRKVKDGDVLKLLRRAIWARTEPKCVDLISQALDLAEKIMKKRDLSWQKPKPYEAR